MNCRNEQFNLADSIFRKLQQFSANLIIVKIGIPATHFAVNTLHSRMGLELVIVAGIALAQYLKDGLTPVTAKLFILQTDRYRSAIFPAVITCRGFFWSIPVFGKIFHTNELQAINFIKSNRRGHKGFHNGHEVRLTNSYSGVDFAKSFVDFVKYFVFFVKYFVDFVVKYF